MIRPSKTAVLIGWGIALAGCAATIVLGWNVLGALAFRGLLELFQAPATGRELSSNSELIWPLVPSGLAIVANTWILWSASPRSNGVSPWWLVPALLIAIGTFLFGVWVCIDVWPSPASATTGPVSSSA